MLYVIATSLWVQHGCLFDIYLKILIATADKEDTKFEPYRQIRYRDLAVNNAL